MLKKILSHGIFNKSRELRASTLSRCIIHSSSFSRRQQFQVDSLNTFTVWFPTISDTGECVISIAITDTVNKRIFREFFRAQIFACPVPKPLNLKSDFWLLIACVFPETQIQRVKIWICTYSRHNNSIIHNKTIRKHFLKYLKP